MQNKITKKKKYSERERQKDQKKGDWGRIVEDGNGVEVEL